MHYFIGFEELEVGQRLKIKGKLDGGGEFMALEISMKAPKDQAEIEGMVQDIDHQEKTLRILNREVALSNGIGIRDLQGHVLGLEGLKVGDMVKLKGKYSESQGFIPARIKMKETMASFNIEELQGVINEVDQEKKTLNVVGFTVAISEKTTIEGF